MEASGFTGPYPTEVATPQIKNDEETSAGSVVTLPSEVATPQVKTDNMTSGGAVEPVPVLATSVGSSVAVATRSSADRIFAQAEGLGQGEASAGYSGALPTLPTTPTLTVAGRELDRPPGKVAEEDSLGYSTALPSVVATPQPSLGTVIADYPPTADAKVGLSTASY